MFEMLDDVEVKKTEFKEIPTGKYKASVTDIEFSEEADQKSVELELVITEGEFEKRKLWLNLNTRPGMTDQAKQILKTQVCNLLGVQSTKGVDTVEALKNVVGNSYNVYVKQNPYNGKMYYRVYINEQIIPF